MIKIAKAIKEAAKHRILLMNKLRYQNHFDAQEEKGEFSKINAKILGFQIIRNEKKQ